MAIKTTANIWIFPPKGKHNQDTFSGIIKIHDGMTPVPHLTTKQPQFTRHRVGTNASSKENMKHRSQTRVKLYRKTQVMGPSTEDFSFSRSKVELKAFVMNILT